MPKLQLLYQPYYSTDPAWLMLMRECYREKKPWEKWLAFRYGLLTKWEHERGSLKCEYCGADNLHKVTEGVARNMRATLDHVIPRSRGGAEYDVDNLVVACEPCNAKKGNKMP